MTVLDAVKKSACTGCTACMACCPVKAISMQYDDEGFIYPIIENEKCIDCSLCTKTCPSLKNELRNTDTPDCFAAWALDKKVPVKSSSGGIFSLLAEKTLQKGGIVVGAAYKDDFHGVHHVIVESINDLQKLCNAKYVQSELGNIFSQIKAYLDEGEKVLFSGTPCQVAGLYSFLGKRYDGLSTVDVICHGVPSPGMFSTFIDEMEEEFGAPVVAINMRDKTKGYWGLSTGIEFENGKKYLVENNDCAWKTAFLKHYSLRPVCHNCKYCSTNRYGDITLGDFWGIGDIDQNLFRKEGNSMVLVNSRKGAQLWKQIDGEKFSCSAPLAIPKTKSANLNNNPAGLHNARDRFFLEWKNNKEFMNSFNKIKNQIAKVGILGWWYYENYGAALTAYGLKRGVEKLGYSAIMIDEPVAKHGSADSQRSKVRNFAKRYLESIQVARRSDLVKLNDKMDIFISGSDQMWNPMLKWISGWEYYLDFVAYNKKKISYASSFGDVDVYDAPMVDIERVGYLLSRFDAISVREDVGKKILAETFNVDAKHVVDPVFFLTKEEYSEIKPTNFKLPQKPYLIAYLGSGSEKARVIIEETAKRKGLYPLVIFDASPDRWEENKKALGMSDKHVLDNVEVGDFVHYVKNASYVITDTFHGTCFSVIFEKSFIALLSRASHNRQMSLLKMLDLEERALPINEALEKHSHVLSDINYTVVNSILQRLTSESREWLESALTKDSSINKPFCDTSLYFETLSLLEKIWDLEWKVNDMESKLKKLEQKFPE